MEHVAQLREVFDSCDATATGRLDRAELTELCTKLHLEPHLHLLLETLLGGRPYARVSFDEFKDGLVAILSRSVDLSTSEDESSYLEPARPEEVQPKFVNGAQRYGRRTHPDPPPGGGPAGPAQTSPPASPTDARRPKLPRSTSLESVESLKSEEDGVQEGGEGGGALEKEAESQMCDDLETSQHNTLELLSESADHLYGEGDHAPITSTPRWHPKHKAVRPAPPAVLCVSAGQRVLSCLDDGSGSTGPERVVALWTQEGVPNGQDILQVLDFPPEERVSLCDLSEALEREMLSSRNSVHQAALVSYRLEIQHLQLQLEQVSRERDKVRGDFQAADRRNLQLVREGDDGHAAMETLNHSRIRDLEQEFRDRLTALRSQSKQESETLQQQVEADRVEFRKEVELLKTQKSRLQEELDTTTQMSGALQVELCEVEESFQEAEQRGARLRRELDLLLGDQLASLDSSPAGRTLDDGVTIRNLQTHCRELQDRNDELSSELLKCQKSCRKSRRSTDDPLWTRPHSLITESDSDEFETYRGVSPLVKRKRDQPGDSVRCEDPAVSIQTELAMEQLRDKHSQELHSLRVELETKVNFYERSLELMRNSMEVERKDISQSFKLEISELEEERSRAEREVLELKEKIEQQKGGAWSSEQERRAQRELSERDQNYTRAINHLVQELSAEKKELEAELKLKMDQEVMLVRAEAEEKLSELKQRQAEAQRHQSAFWEKRLLLVEQKAQEEEPLGESVRRSQEELRTTSCQLEEASRILSQSEHSFEQKEVELRCSEGRSSKLKAELRCSEGRSSKLEADLRLSDERRSQLEAELRCSEGRGSQLEAELQYSEGRSSELEERLHEACSQLEESIHLLEAQEEVKNQLTLERSSLQEERSSLQEERSSLQEELNSLQEESGLRRIREEELHQEASRLKEALDGLHDHGLLREEERQALLLARERSIASLRCDLQEAQETLRTREETQTRLSSELDSLRTDRSGLIQDLKEQATAVDTLRAELDGRRSGQEALQEQLKQERSQGALLKTSLEEEREEAGRLAEEKARYLGLADQLSTQIVEMEDEISSLRHHLGALSVQLNRTADLVLELRGQLRARAGGLTGLQDRLALSQARLQRMERSSARLHKEVERLTSQLEEQGRELSSVRDASARGSVAGLRRELLEEREGLRRAEEASEVEMGRMKQQLLEMEELVVSLEGLAEPGGPRRRQVEEGQAELSCLEERNSSLQQDVLRLEETLQNKTRRLEEVEREHERRREEEERLHKENVQSREEVLALSGRNLQLSGENAELSSRLRGDQEALRLLRERLEKVTKEHQEGAAKVRELEEKEVQKERERLQLLSSWKHERELLERELTSAKEKAERAEVLEEDLVSLRLKQQWVEQDKTRLLEETEHRTQQLEALQAEVCSVDGEVEMLRSQLQSVTLERNGQAEEVASQHRKLQDVQQKMEELQEVQRINEEHQELTISAMQEEIRTLHHHNQDLLQRVSLVQNQEEEVQRLNQDCQTLRSRHTQLESARTMAEDQAVRSDTSRAVLQAKVSQQLQEVRQEVEGSSRQQLHLLQVRLEEQIRRSQGLEEELRTQALQASSQLHTHQQQQQLAEVQERLQQTETKVKSLRLLLQDKSQQLTEQVGSSLQSSQLLQSLYLENSQLVKALQVTESRQKNAEKRSGVLEDKVSALNSLIRDMVRMSLAT
ncbi:ninein-like protein isoform X2 [Gadus macrocephalus]|uniref:ninein-like protein isoform X2 n=1 Tax=Gadus macrocephalus TaxID=80720 RepID=UPI0028CBACE7|nr:ninein-like protein isoform X2 [Gadus macrocephalus]